MSERVLIVGAGSGIGRALCRAFAAEGANLVLAGRRPDELAGDAADLALRFGIEAHATGFEALDREAIEKWWEERFAEADGGIDGLVLCLGDMPPQARAASEPAAFTRMVEINYTAPTRLLLCAARDLRARGRGGFLLGVSSVAGVRGRASNHLYGSTKAALSTVLSGLRSELSGDGIAVVDLRPGVIDTAMTWGLDMPLAAAPERVARAGVRAVRRNRAVVYTPGLWWPIMTVIRLLPDFIFRRLRF